MSKYLLREYYQLCDGDVCKDLLTEAEKKKVANGVVILAGKLQEADVENGNGRVYPLAILEREIKKYKKLVEARRALGELDHPETSVVNLQNVSHMVTEVWLDGSSVMGKIECLNTPSGKVLQEIVKAGCPVGISSRGLGSVKESKGKTIVEDDFNLICFDMVSEPSTPEAFMLTEAKEPGMIKTSNKKTRLMNALDSLLVKK